MINRNKRTLLIPFLLSLKFTLFAQVPNLNCYVPLFDGTGVSVTADQLDELKNVACQLRDSLPSIYQDSFRVFDAGVYILNEKMPGGTRGIFDKSIQEAKAQSKYYVIFGKQSSSNGINTGFWVEINLPKQESFSCLAQENPTFNFDLSYKYEVIANTIHKSKNFIPQLYYIAERDCMKQLAAQIGKISRCCNAQGVKICNACLLTPQEIRNYLESQGYTATPVKILSTPPAKNDSLNKSLELPRIADLCTDITSIEIDSTICYDFPSVINHIMDAFPDDTGVAQISDDDCLCNGGSLEYLKATPYNGTWNIRLKIHLSPSYGSGIDDVVYSRFFAPYQLGVLPFNAYMPNRISESDDPPPTHSSAVNMEYAKSTVESIYSKNGINLNSISLQIPSPSVDEYLIYNGLEYFKDCKTSTGERRGPGRSERNFNIMQSGGNFVYGGGNHIEFWYFQDYYYIFLNSQHLNYAIGHHFAHEFLHQMVGMSLGYFKEFGLSTQVDENNADVTNLSHYYAKKYTTGHTNDQLNLLLEGSFFQGITQINNCTFLTTEQKHKLLSLTGWQGQYKHLCPKAISENLQQMEQISPGYKALFTYFKIMRSLVDTYPDKTSPEIICGSKILVNTIRMMKLEKYDGF